MDVTVSSSTLSGHIQVPGSKSHTIRALLLASLAEGTSVIKNPLASADCLSTSAALPLLGATVHTPQETPLQEATEWHVHGAGNAIHLPSDVVNVGDSGSLLYFLAPIAATFEGWSVFTGDELIRRRPVHHVVDALKQLGGEAYTRTVDVQTCPLIIKGAISGKNQLITGGTISSQYISGLLMASLRLKEPLSIHLTDPKETPYITMTQQWLTRVGANVSVSPDFKSITAHGNLVPKRFDCVIPSDWEAVAFPLVAALITNSSIIIDNADFGGTQGDAAIVDILTAIGADICIDTSAARLVVNGGSKAKNKGYLSTENAPGGELHIPISPFPDAVCALAVIACFTEGTTIIEDAAVCRRKETDRLAVLHKELAVLGANIEETPDSLIIHGHAPVLKDGSKNPQFVLHGGVVQSYNDHRIAMALACLGLGLESKETLTVKNAECCAVSFPHFFSAMAALGARFVKTQNTTTPS